MSNKHYETDVLQRFLVKLTCRNSQTRLVTSDSALYEAPDVSAAYALQLAGLVERHPYPDFTEHKVIVTPLEPAL